MTAERGVCALCYDAGMVCNLPSLKALELGQWTTQAAWCRCFKGRQGSQQSHGVDSAGQSRPPLMTLAEYESRCPNWRTLQAEHESECIRDLRATYGQSRGELDDALNAIADRVREMRDG